MVHVEDVSCSRLLTVNYLQSIEIASAERHRKSDQTESDCHFSGSHHSFQFFLCSLRNIELTDTEDAASRDALAAI